jgi:lipoyl(octanoyl) transferase
VIAVLHLGLIDYGTALRLQETLAGLRQQGRIPDVLLLLEHPPVITLGRNAKQVNLVASRELLAARGVEVFEINRGGDVTFHGPGQLVGYPIFDLRGFTPRLGAVDYVRKLEEVLMRTCAHYGIPTRRIPGMTGVWTQLPDPQQTPSSPRRWWEEQEQEERKIAAIGVHISRGVTSHGFALNVTTDLEHFKLIVPCGLSKPVTSMALESGAPVPMAEVITMVARQFGEVFNAQVVRLEALDELLAAAGELSPQRRQPPPSPGTPLPPQQTQPPRLPGTPHEAWPQDTPAKAPEELRRLRGEDTHLA